MTTFSKILLPIDFTECSTAVLSHAKLMKEKFDADIYLLYAMPGSEQYKGLNMDSEWLVNYGHSLKREAENAMENFINQHMQGFEPKKAVVRIGEVVTETATYVDEEGIDLIITASHGCRTAENRIYGSIAEGISRESGCPVMIVHP
ncbi:universal stress protein UspA-like protein [Desulfocapsa sulfexigens DSM 10523]|uniref:Universal stress protein UspA-like protein n=1 Tax=Desulfocapsa sulfexigens (strain DSM 10523 / SB164P1) TaxID=1167006 RepID=M1PE79_DESSD|nr:universal stress protein [Desulfocapsa sulfexigens]AGF77990.1 universal stress protein UspA-like protein [Desulfocapsa sulfexigens DSM 10523]